MENKASLEQIAAIRTIMSFVRYNNSDYAPLQNDSQDMVDPNIELHELAANTLASSLV